MSMIRYGKQWQAHSHTPFHIVFYIYINTHMRTYLDKPYHMASMAHMVYAIIFIHKIVHVRLAAQCMYVCLYEYLPCA